MTAQAGAVAAWRELFTQADIDAAVKAGDRIEYTAFKSDAIDLPCSDLPGSEGWIRVRNPTVGDANHGRVRALTTPPAAVPVEALEGLVADWRKQAALLRDKTLPFPERMERRFMAACDADQAADELTQLIKERSNG